MAFGTPLRLLSPFLDDHRRTIVAEGADALLYSAAWAVFAGTLDAGARIKILETLMAEWPLQSRPGSTEALGFVLFAADFAGVSHEEILTALRRQLRSRQTLDAISVAAQMRRDLTQPAPRLPAVVTADEWECRRRLPTSEGISATDAPTHLKLSTAILSEGLQAVNRLSNEGLSRIAAIELSEVAGHEIAGSGHSELVASASARLNAARRSQVGEDRRTLLHREALTSCIDLHLIETRGMDDVALAEATFDLLETLFPTWTRP